MSIVQIMTHRSKLVTTLADANLASLREVFAKARFQHVPVVEQTNRLVGIVSVKDYFRELSPVMDSASDPSIAVFMRSRKVHQVMITPVITLSENSTVKQAAALLLQHNISCLPVVDEHRHLLGLVSWKDILRAALGKSATGA
ncbi:CBS domain-containing protein [Rheinheimera maricola]|uniref:CBS domain-containing protein n=1 Tax=Rheinheimera maricola TaxID=2793282 RepID=A0ABS7X9X0_9GAMM|nr:CBS domain-containing protein [Rheinheimera maricola]MBZ9611945.1 CBS domain-containing protein [Rheinheimera maricola]